MKFLFYLISSFIFLCQLVTASNLERGTVKGTVLTSERAPAAYVTVVLKGTNYGTQTNEKGEYLFKVPGGSYTLLIQLLGLEPKEQPIEIKAGETQTLEPIILSESKQQLDEIVVKGNRASYKAENVSDQLRLQTKLIETPQSITIITQDAIKDQLAFNVNELARNVSGVNSVFSYTNLYADFNIRGGGQSTGSNRLRNGIRPNGYAMMEDANNIERIEFVKGPAGFMMNYGDPGGLFNVVTKQPTKEKIRSFGLWAGSFNMYRATSDFGGAIGGDSSKWSYRFTSSYHTGGLWQERHTFNRISVAPSVRYDLSNNTYIVAEYNLNWSKSRGGDPTIPSVNGKPFVLFQTFSVADPNLPGFYNWDHMGSLKLVHKFNERWKFNGNVALSEATWEGYDMTTRNPVDSAGFLTRQVRYTHYNGSNTLGQFFFTGTERTGSITHKILGGVDIGLQQTAYPSYVRHQTDYLKININAPSYGLIPDSLTNFPISRVGDRDEQSWQSVYLQDHIQLFSFLQVSLAGRFSDFKQYASWNIPEEQNQRFTLFTPRLGITYLPLRNLSIYALYDQSFVPQTGRLATRGQLKPLRGSIIEAGVKKEWFNGKLFTNIALYDISRDNITNADPFNPGFVIQTAQAKTTGFELDITGKITNELSIIANYAYTNGRVTKDRDSSVVGKLPYGIAKHISNIWLKYKLTKIGILENFSVSAGGTYDSGRGGGTFSRDGNYSKTTPEYLIFNAGIYYDTPFISYGFLIDNITNQKYMTGGYWDAEWYYKAGSPTAFRFNVNVRL